MARGARRRGRSGRGGLPSACVEWMPINDIGADTTQLLTAGAPNSTRELYDFSSAAKYADNFGGGDWTVERTLGKFACVPTVGTTTTLIKVCFGIGMVNGPTSVALVATAVDIQLPSNGPQLSWMVYVCCYIDINDQVTVDRCEFDMKSRRRIAPDSQIWTSIQPTPAPVSAEVISTLFDFRMLLRQRGSRL